MRPLHIAVLTALLMGIAGTTYARQGESAPAAGQGAVPAADEQPPRAQAGVAGIIGIPLGKFHDNVEISGGISGSVGIGLADGPISLGAEATYLTYGGENRNLPVGGLPDLTVGVNTSNDIFLFHGRVRAQKLSGRVRPYVDGLIGFNYLITSTEVDAEEYCSSISGGFSCSDDGDSATNLDDLVFSAGGGGGVAFALTRSGRVRLDLSLRYLYGGEANYLTEGDIVWEAGGPPMLTPRRTRTDMLLIGIGIAVGR
jgi:hypothetical protein